MYFEIQHVLNVNSVFSRRESEVNTNIQDYPVQEYTEIGGTSLWFDNQKSRHKNPNQLANLVQDETNGENSAKTEDERILKKLWTNLVKWRKSSRMQVECTKLSNVWIRHDQIWKEAHQGVWFLHKIKNILHALIDATIEDQDAIEGESEIQGAWDKVTFDRVEKDDCWYFECFSELLLNAKVGYIEKGSWSSQPAAGRSSQIKVKLNFQTSQVYHWILPFTGMGLWMRLCLFSFMFGIIWFCVCALKQLKDI